MAAVRLTRLLPQAALMAALALSTLVPSAVDARGIHYSDINYSDMHYTGFLQLNDAIQQANRNGLACAARPSDLNCLGALVTVTLTADVVLTSALLPLNYSAHLAITGACTNSKTQNRCIIDGAGKFQVFPSVDINRAAPSLLELNSLIFQNARGGVLANTFSVVRARSTVFRNNKGGAVNGFGSGAKPPQTYEDCEFLGNAGTAFQFCADKLGLTSNGTGLTFRRTLFQDNVGSPNADAGAVFLSGGGVTLFEDVSFINNKGVEAGGAVYAFDTEVRFRRVKFTGNALSKNGGAGGGAVYGAVGMFYGLKATFCSCLFEGNTNPFSASTASLVIELNSDVTVNGPVVTFCSSSIPQGSVFKRSTVQTPVTSECSSKYC